MIIVGSANCQFALSGKETARTNSTLIGGLTVGHEDAFRTNRAN